MNSLITLFFSFIIQIFEVQTEPFPIADLSMFGSCVIHLKRFRDNLVFIDLTTIVVLAQINNGQFPLFSIFNGSNPLPQIQPVDSLQEECSLQVLIGIHPRPSWELYDFMFSSRYTFNSNPHSIYIVLLDPSGNFPYVDRSSTMFPASIFVWKVPITNPIIHNAEDELRLKEHRFWYVCVRCSNFWQLVGDNKNIRYISEVSYESNWYNSKLVLQAIVTTTTGDKTGCEKYIWKLWLAPIGDHVRDDYKYCSKSLAFTDILARSVHSNLTVFLQPREDLSQDGFSGFFVNGIWSPQRGIDHWRASNISFRGWLNCFEGTIWMCIIVVTALAHSYICIQHYFRTWKYNIHTYINFAFDIVEILIRQGSCKCCLIAIFSLGGFIVSTVFENSLTSSLIVPNMEKEFSLSDLIELGYRIIYVGGSMVFGSQLMYVEKLFNISNVYLQEDNVVTMTVEIQMDPETFSSRKLALFAFVTPGAVKMLGQQIHSTLHSNHSNSCLCRTIAFPDLKLPLASTYLHGMKFRIFHIKELLMQSGIDQLFDQDMGNASPDLLDDIIELETSGNENQFLSLQNLVPLFVGGCVLAGISGVIFLIETTIAACIHGRGNIVVQSSHSFGRFCVNN
jgi:hypothetical protein